MAEAFSSSDKLPSGSGKLLRAALQLDNQEDIELGLHHCRLFPSKGICRGQWAGLTQAGGRAGAARQQEPPSAMLTTSDISASPQGPVPVPLVTMADSAPLPGAP